MRLFTLGHSTHSLDDYCALLDAHDVTRVADVRRFPQSRRHPQFRAESLAESLPARGIDYRHLPALERADVACLVLNFSLNAGVDLSDAIRAKMAKNAIKYPANA